MPTAAPVLEYKAFEPMSASVVEDAPGTVVALVAVTGNTDDGGDIIAPGAFHFKRNPKVVWSHDLKTLVGKVLKHEELPPGHVELPADLIEKGLGALRFTVAFDLDDPESFKAYRKVVFHEDLGWSIGYETPPDGFKVLPDGRRLLTKIYVWEGSPTTFGMNLEARTMSAKSMIRSTLDRLDLDDTKAKTIESLFESVAGETGETKSLPALTGSFEETQDLVRDAIREWASTVYGEVGPENDWWVRVDGTFDSTVVATIKVWNGPYPTTTYQWNYTQDADGSILLSEPTAVDIRATVAPAGTTPPTPPAASVETDTTAAVPAPVPSNGQITPATPPSQLTVISAAPDLDFKEAREILETLDTKKGAVLSAANASKLQAAQEAIAKVLAAAAKLDETEGEKTAVVAREIVAKGEGGVVEAKTATPATETSVEEETGGGTDHPAPSSTGEGDDVVPVSDADLVEMMALADS